MNEGKKLKSYPLRAFLPAVFAVLLAALLLAPVHLCAQNLTGEIDGVVKDSSGAVVVNATVTVKNTDQNLVDRTVRTNGQGEFTAPLLSIGNYAVTVEMSGFQATTENVSVHVNQPVSLDVALTPGNSTQTVQVTANSVAPELNSAAAGTLINHRQMTQLSLSSRNFEQLLYIQPGISGPIPGPKDRGSISPSGALNPATFAVNGQPTNSNGYFLDGQDLVIHAGNQPAIFPSIDFVQETNLQRSNYGAQYGGSGSAIITLETKSGTNAFHGGAYEFFRSQIMNANGYFNNLAKIARPGIRYNDYGYDVGGPVWIPKLTERASTRTFFFFGQEFLRSEAQTSETITNIPTAAQKAGIFSAPVCTRYNSAGQCAQSSNTIRTIDPTAAAYVKDILNKIPLPNNPNDPQGLIASQQGYENETQTIIRIDHQFNDKLSVFFRYLDDPFHLTVPNGILTTSGVPGVGTSVVTAGGTTYLGHATYVLNSNTVLEGGYAHMPAWLTALPIGLMAPQNAPDFRPTLPYTSTLARIPSVTINGRTFTTVGPYNQRTPDTQVFLNVNHVAGRHTFNFGFSLDWNQSGNNAASPVSNAGLYVFSAGALPAGSTATQFDQSFANMLLGNVATFQQVSINAASQIVQHVNEGYFQDDFRITPRLTLNGGVRYSYIRQPTNNPLSGFAALPIVNFDPRVYNPQNAPTIGSNGLICTTAPCPGGGTPNPSYAPLNGVIVGGKNSPYGDKVTSQPVLTFAPRFGFALDVFGNGRAAIRGGYGIYYMPPVSSAGYQTMVYLNTPNVSNTTISNTSFGNPGNGVPVLSAAPQILQAAQPEAEVPYLQAWNLDLQQQLSPNTVLDLGYFGNRGVHQGAQEDINQPVPGTYVTDRIIPGNKVTAGNSVLLNQIRPYKGYGPINSFNQIFNSNYNALQVSFTKRLHDGNIINANYTWSNSLSNIGTPQSIYNLEPEYGPTGFDRRSLFNANFVYLLPFYRTQAGLRGHLLGGWQVTGIISYGSGLYLTAHTVNVDPGGVGDLATGSNAVGTARPDYVSDPNRKAPHTLTQWFNTSAFAQVPAGQYRPGNDRVGNIAGPGYSDWDLSLFKNFKIYQRLNMQLRGESFNTFNHTNFSGVATTLGLTNYGQVTTAGPARVMQLAAKINF